MIYLGFSEAFDHVPHAFLIFKLSGYGINGLLLKWIDNFLTDWKQRVCVKWSWCNVTSGVPQDSVSGPILFIIYVNDLPEVVQSSLCMFADDTKIYHTIYSDVAIMRWCSIWLMNLIVQVYII